MYFLGGAPVSTRRFVAERRLNRRMVAVNDRGAKPSKPKNLILTGAAVAITLRRRLPPGDAV